MHKSPHDRVDTSENLKIMSEMETVWISLASRLADDLILEHLWKNHSTCKAFHEACTAIFITLGLLLYVFVYTPLCESIANGLKYALLSLLAIPEDLSIKIPTLKPLLEEIFEPVLRT
jgi:hypothetical protein